MTVIYYTSYEKQIISLKLLYFSVHNKMVAFMSQCCFSGGLAIWTLSKRPMQVDGLFPKYHSAYVSFNSNPIIPPAINSLYSEANALPA